MRASSVDITVEGVVACRGLGIGDIQGVRAVSDKPCETLKQNPMNETIQMDCGPALRTSEVVYQDRPCAADEYRIVARNLLAKVS